MINIENIKNIYYMIAYAYRKDYFNNVKKLVETEKFNNSSDMFAFVLSSCVETLIKRGLFKDYKHVKSFLTRPKGKIKFTETFLEKTHNSRKICCSYFELTNNILFNQIIKSTLLFLLHKPIKNEHKIKINLCLRYLSSIDNINLNGLDWDNIQYNRLNVHYKGIIDVCKLAYDNHIYTSKKGNGAITNFFINDDLFSSLYENFVRNYFKVHFPSLGANAEQIPWDAQSDQYLPRMKTDIVLKNKTKTLIIDTKFYSNGELTIFNKAHSGNLYQIYAYVKNYQTKNKNKIVTGMLLYANTDDKKHPNPNFEIGNNKFHVQTLNLNESFSDICKNLNQIAKLLQ